MNKTKISVAKQSRKSSKNQDSTFATETRQEVKVTACNNPKPNSTSKKHTKAMENIQRTPQVGALKSHAIEQIGEDLKPSSFSGKQSGKNEEVQKNSKEAKPKVKAPYTVKYLKRSLETEILRKV